MVGEPPESVYQAETTGSHKSCFSDVKKYSYFVVFRLKCPHKTVNFRPHDKRAAKALCRPIGTLMGKSMQKMKTHPDLGGLFGAQFAGISTIGAIIAGFSSTPKSGRFTGFSGGGCGDSGAYTGPDFPYSQTPHNPYLLFLPTSDHASAFPCPRRLLRRTRFPP